MIINISMSQRGSILLHIFDKKYIGGGCYTVEGTLMILDDTMLQQQCSMVYGFQNEIVATNTKHTVCNIVLGTLYSSELWNTNISSSRSLKPSTTIILDTVRGNG